MWKDLGDFLAEPWWAGVQGVVSVIGVAAVVVAVVDFIVRRRHGAPSAVAYGITDSGITENGWRAITITVRAMGPKVLYEPAWITSGFTAFALPELPPVMTSTSPEIAYVLRIPTQQLPSAYVGIAWVEPRRYRSFAGGSRMVLMQPRQISWWRAHYWTWWPRRTTGTWVLNRPGGKRSRLSLPTS